MVEGVDSLVESEVGREVPAMMVMTTMTTTKQASLYESTSHLHWSSDEDEVGSRSPTTGCTKAQSEEEVTISDVFKVRFRQSVVVV